MESSPEGVTVLLRAWSNGDESALEKLIPRVYRELHRLARRFMARERPDHTLQASALVNEAYVRLIDANQVEWRDRAHFFAVTARLMRRILVDHARTRGFQKRGGGADLMPLEDDLEVVPQSDSRLLAINDALDALAKLDPRKAQVVEMKFFGGLGVEEMAEVLNLSTDTIKRDWRLARSWLLRELKQKGGSSPAEGSCPG